MLEGLFAPRAFSDAWHLAPKGVTSCDSGHVASASECESVVQALAAAFGETLGTTVNVAAGSGGICNDNAMGSIPEGCHGSTCSAAEGTTFPFFVAGEFLAPLYDNV